MATVPQTPRTNRFTLASPSAGPFNVGFRLFSGDGIKVYVDHALTADYTVAATFVDGFTDTATITFGSSLPTSTVVQIDGALLPDRQEDYANPDPGLTRKMNIELARIAAALSELNMKISRTVRGFDDLAPVDGISAVDLVNLAAYADEAEAARDAVVAIEAMLPRRKGPWLTATVYVFGDLVQRSGSTYFCLVNHTSGTFTTDLADLKWEVWAAKGDAGAGVGDVVAANAGSEYTALAALFRSNVGLVIGTHVQAYNQLLGAISGLGATGIIARLSGSTAAARTFTGTANQITVTNGDGVSGNPTIAAVVASQAEAEAGADATKLMTSQRVSQAIAAQVSGRTLLAAKTASAIANLSFTEFNNAVYRLYEFEFENLKPATDGVYFFMRTSTDGGAVYDSTAGHYYWGVNGTGTGSSRNDLSDSATQILLTASGLLVGNAVAEYGVSGKIAVLNAPLAVPTEVHGFISYWRDNGDFCRFSVGGCRVAAADVDAVRFAFSSGNIASGTIRMFGVR